MCETSSARLGKSVKGRRRSTTNSIQAPKLPNCDTTGEQEQRGHGQALDHLGHGRRESQLYSAEDQEIKDIISAADITEVPICMSQKTTNFLTTLSCDESGHSPSSSLPSSRSLSPITPRASVPVSVSLDPGIDLVGPYDGTGI